MDNNRRLSLNFHQTFIPERRYLSILLDKIGQNLFLSDKELSALTSIPMGDTSGKLPATLAYAKGMGLVKLTTEKQRSISLTPLGELVKIEDPYLQEELTQWIMHLELCKKSNGAELWYQVFNTCFKSFNSTFNTDQLENLLEQIIHKKKRNIIGPLLRTYAEDSALSLVDIVEADKNNPNQYLINSPPLLDSFGYYYGYLLISLWEETDIKSDNQVTITSLNEKTEIIDQLNFNSRQFETLLLNIESLGLIDIDKQMSPWILIKKSTKENILKKIYDLL